MTKSQDVVIALKLSLALSRPSYAELAKSLGMSAAEVHAGVRRLVMARLHDPESKQVNREALAKFLVHGVPARLSGALGRGDEGNADGVGRPGDGG